MNPMISQLAPRLAAFGMMGVLLFATLGLVGAGAPEQSAPGKIPKLSREGMTQEEWMRAMMAQGNPFGSSHEARWSTFTLPAHHVVVGQVVDGVWTVGVYPEDATPMRAWWAIEPGHDCFNDVRELPFATTFPLTANLLFPLAPNLASADACDGTRGLHTGPIAYMTFSVNGDVGGEIQLSDDFTKSYFAIGCGPAWPFSDETAAAVSGVGFEQAWKTTFEASDSRCAIETIGVQPSEYGEPWGNIVNWNDARGTAYGGYLTHGQSTNLL